MAVNQVMKLQEFADLLRVHVNTVRNWKSQGMPCIKFGNTVRIEAYEAIAWLKNRADIADNNLGEGEPTNGRKNKRSR